MKISRFIAGFFRAKCWLRDRFKKLFFLRLTLLLFFQLLRAHTRVIRHFFLSSALQRARQSDFLGRIIGSLRRERDADVRRVVTIIVVVNESPVAMRRARTKHRGSESLLPGTSLLGRAPKITTRASGCDIVREFCRNGNAFVLYYVTTVMKMLLNNAYCVVLRCLPYDATGPIHCTVKAKFEG